MSDFVSTMRARARIFASLCAALAAVATLGTAVRAQTCNTDLCTEPLTSTVYLNNNEYGNRNPVYGSQSITANGSSAWSTSWSYSGAPVNYNIRSYSSAVLGWQYGWLDSGTGLPVALSSHTPVNTTSAYTVSGSTQWMDVSYDCWFHTVNNPGSSTPQSDEMMIWLADYGSLDPGTPAAVSNITIDGIAWDAYHGTAGSWNYVAWYPHGQTSWDLHGATLNITDFTDAAVNNGIIDGSHYLTSVQFGTEIYNNGSGTLNVTNYTVKVGGGGSAPPAPTGLSATAGNAQVSLSWNSSSGATAYDVKRSTVSGSGYATVSSPTGTSYTNTGLTNGTTYYFVVDAKNSIGTSGNSNQASATPTSGGGGGGVVSINCGGSAASPFIADADFGSGTKTYSVSNTISTSGVSNPAPQAVYQTERASDGSNGGTFTYTMPGLTANAAYTVRLHFAEIFYSTGGQRTMNVTINSTQVLTNFDIFNAAGGEFKANVQQFSTIANGSGQIAIIFSGGGAKIDGIEIVNPSSAPPAPTGLTATAGNTQVALAWTASTGATSYNVLRSTVSGSGYASVAGITTTTYTNTGLTNGTAYYFVVTATNANGTSGNSNQASATPKITAPAAPTGLTATPGNAQVALSWNASTGATAYDVKRSTVSGSGYATVSSPTVTNYTNTGLTNGTTYYFVVDAKNAGGTSGNSSQVSATPTASLTPVLQINCGGSAASPFIADTDFGAGTKTYSVTNTISTSGVSNPAPQAVYQTERASDGSNGGAFTYTIPGLTANAAYTVRLHFAEIFYSSGGQRSMNVTINGNQVLTNYDIFNAAGGEFKAVAPQFSTNANGSGQIAITFGGGGAKVDGIEVLH